MYSSCIAWRLGLGCWLLKLGLRIAMESYIEIPAREGNDWDEMHSVFISPNTLERKGLVNGS